MDAGSSARARSAASIPPPVRIGTPSGCEQRSRLGDRSGWTDCRVYGGASWVVGEVRERFGSGPRVCAAQRMEIKHDRTRRPRLLAVVAPSRRHASLTDEMEGTAWLERGLDDVRSVRRSDQHSKRKAWSTELAEVANRHGRQRGTASRDTTMARSVPSEVLNARTVVCRQVPHDRCGVNHAATSASTSADLSCLQKRRSHSTASRYRSLL